MIRLLAVLILVFFQTLSVFGQQTAIDSLLRLLSETHSELQRVNLLNEIAFSYYDYDVNNGFEYASRAYELARKIEYPQGLRYSLILKGYHFYETGQYSDALKYYRQASQVKMPAEELLGYDYILTANVHRSLAQYDSAKHYYDKGIEILTSLNKQGRLAYALKSMARLYVLQWKNKEAEECFQKALKIYESTNNAFGMADVWFSLADVYKNFSDYPTATLYVEKACKIAAETNDAYLKMYCSIHQGEIQYRLGEYTQALQTFVKAVDMLQTKELPQTLSRVYINLGDIYEGLGQNDVALQYFFDALKISEKLNIKHEIANIYSSMAWIYKNQHNFSLAHEYVDKSLKLREEIKDEHGISNAYNVLGIIYLVEKKYNLSIVFLEKSLAIRKRIKHLEGMSACLYNIGLVYEEQKQYRKALQYQIEAMRLDQASGNKFSLGVSYNSMGTLHSHLNQFDSARYYLKLAEDISRQTKSLNLLMNNAYYWAEYYELKGDFRQALHWHKQYSNVNDSIYYEASAKKLAEMQALYQAEQKDQEIKLLNQEKLLQSNEIQLQKARINAQNIVIVSGIFAFLLVSLLALKTYQYNKRIEKANRAITEQKEEIEAQSEELKEASQTITEINKQLEAKVEERTAALRQAYKELDTFFYRSSHDFRRPLTTFFGLSEVAQITVKDPNALELFAKVKDTARNLDKMLVKLQSISDLGGQELVYKEVFLKEIYQEVCDGFRQEIDAKGVKVYLQVDLKHTFYSYPALVKIIIENLVENSVSFSVNDNPFVKLHAYEEGHNVILRIEDNGEGIEEQYHDRVFEMYFRGSERSKGNGLGLYIAKKAVEKLNGRMCFQSCFNKGTTFKVALPFKIEA